MFYVYLLQSKERIYTGMTSDLKRRVHEHNTGQNVSTKAYVPWSLIFYEAYIDREDASRREKYLKTTQGKRTVRTMLRHHFENQSQIRSEDQGATTG